VIAVLSVGAVVGLGVAVAVGVGVGSDVEEIDERGARQELEQETRRDEQVRRDRHARSSCNPPASDDAPEINGLRGGTVDGPSLVDIASTEPARAARRDHEQFVQGARQFVCGLVHVVQRRVAKSLGSRGGTGIALGGGSITRRQPMKLMRGMLCFAFLALGACAAEPETDRTVETGVSEPDEATFEEIGRRIGADDPSELRCWGDDAGGLSCCHGTTCCYFYEGEVYCG
jgi:hypothetical protein